MSKVVGIDLGGTKIAAVLLDAASGSVLADVVIPTEGKRGPDAVIERMAITAREVAEKANVPLTDVMAVGVGVPATIDLEAGLTLMLPNLPGSWVRKPVAPMLNERLGRPVFLINDARAFTLAEATLGAGRGARTVACFTLGTGIGGGIAIDGRLHLGMIGSAGEFGHQTIAWDGPPDGSGAPGGLESLCSGPAIAAMGAKAVMQGWQTQIGALAGYDLNKITPETVARAAEAGDAIAQEIMHRAAECLAAGIGNVLIILAPDRVVIGGGVAKLGDILLAPMRESLKKRVTTLPMDQVQIVHAALGGDAGAIGAALWAYQRASGQS